MQFGRCLGHGAEGGAARLPETLGFLRAACPLHRHRTPCAAELLDAAGLLLDLFEIAVHLDKQQRLGVFPELGAGVVPDRCPGPPGR